MLAVFMVLTCVVSTAFLRMLIVRNRLAEDRLANCRACHTNLLVKSLTHGRIGLMKSGREAVENWVEIWYYAAVTCQTACKKWLTRVKYNRFFRGESGVDGTFTYCYVNGDDRLWCLCRCERAREDIQRAADEKQAQKIYIGTPTPSHCYLY
jgi:hypothetical protein